MVPALEVEQGEKVNGRHSNALLCRPLLRETFPGGMEKTLTSMTAGIPEEWVARLTAPGRRK